MLGMGGIVIDGMESVTASPTNISVTYFFEIIGNILSERSSILISLFLLCFFSLYRFV